MILRGIKMILNIDLLKWKHLSPKSQKQIEKQATSKQKNDQFYDIALSDFPDHEICKLLNKKFDQIDYEALLEIHESRENSIQKFKFKKTAAIWFGTFGYLLTVIPPEFVERFVSYENYVISVTSYLILSSAMSIIFLAIIFRKYYKERKYSKDIEYLLKYSKMLKTT